ncbi:MAG TPA: hypothetical protein DCP20_08765 [Coriobacteriia bacterium]|nr:hypothetical protein [Coriobacteriia bacterium]
MDKPVNREEAAVENKQPDSSTLVLIIGIIIVIIATMMGITSDGQSTGSGGTAGTMSNGDYVPY